MASSTAVGRHTAHAFHMLQDMNSAYCRHTCHITLPLQVPKVKHILLDEDFASMEYVACRDIERGEVVSIYSPIHSEIFMFEQSIHGNLAVHPDWFRVYESETKSLSEEGRLLLATRKIKKGEYLRVIFDPQHQCDASLFCNAVPSQQDNTTDAWLAALTSNDMYMQAVEADIEEMLKLF